MDDVVVVVMVVAGGINGGGWGIAVVLQAVLVVAWIR